MEFTQKKKKNLNYTLMAIPISLSSKKNLIIQGNNWNWLKNIKVKLTKIEVG